MGHKVVVEWPEDAFDHTDAAVAVTEEWLRGAATIQGVGAPEVTGQRPHKRNLSYAHPTPAKKKTAPRSRRAT